MIAGGMGPARYQGIEYASIPEALRLAGVKPAQRAAVRAGLLVMQDAALAAIQGREEVPDE